MDRREKHRLLREIVNGSFDGYKFHVNNVKMSSDLKSILLFHTSDADLAGSTRAGLYVTADVYEAIQQWSSRLAKKQCYSVNVYTLDLDEAPEDILTWRNGDNYECYHGGAGRVLLVQYLQHVAFVPKNLLNETVMKLGYWSLRDMNMEKIADHLLFGVDSDSYVVRDAIDELQNSKMHAALFYSHSNLYNSGWSEVVKSYTGKPGTIHVSNHKAFNW